jgi:uncharacterized membrane protein
MFKKILIADRGENDCEAGVSSHCLSREACAGDFIAETAHV